ncbi:polynucleotide kinase-phosphatase [Hymenobacter sp. B1770]|uniref:polynucleotide kinase-phosphatase n=1 Tax=Hymenobacter sp. B1770 TaxID=1718788 RepID=UPI003CF76224
MAKNNLKVPELCLVVLLGSSGAGKSTFARRLFKPTEIVSSDICRGLVADDENDQSASQDAFELLHYMVAKRLKRGLLTVVDATNVQEEARKPLVALARQYHVLPVAIVLDVPDAVAYERNALRPERRGMGPHVVARHRQLLRKSLRNLKQEGFRHIHVLRGVEEVDAIQGIVRDRLYNNRKEETGPFDIIGDVHGCYEELRALLEKLGYEIFEEPIEVVRDLGVRVIAPLVGRDATLRVSALDDAGMEGSDGADEKTRSVASLQSADGARRKAVFLGDLVDRGPASPQVLRLVMSMVRDGSALCVPGNHDIKLLRHLNGKKVTVNHGLAETLAQLEPEPEAFRSEVRRFLDGLVSHYVLDGGKLVVAHAGLIEEMQGRGSGAVRAFALFGESTGEIDEFGLPVRYEWAREYRGRAMVAFGHTPVPDAEWLNNTIDIDTGCVFGGRLTALRYPERELVAVPAAQVYCEPVRPLSYRRSSASSADTVVRVPEGNPNDDNGAETRTTESALLTAQHQHDDLLDIRDVTGKQFIETRLMRGVTICEDNAVAALEVMSRFALNPKWLLYLPPTMSPTETSALPDLLEHPAEALDYYKRLGVERVVCEEKHMGSRVVVVLGRDEAAIQRRLGLVSEGIGKCYTRTGRNFFTDAALEASFLARLRDALSAAVFWEKFDTDWVCLDAELLPWSAKAQELVKNQYAAVAAANSALPQVEAALTEAAARNLDGAEALLARTTARRQAAAHYADAYRRYCWPVHSLYDLKLAPFHLLATEGRTYFDRDHAWHMETLRTLALADPGLLRATPYRVVPLHDPAEVEAAIQWWTDLTAAGGEGMVVKPYDFVPQGKSGLLQPALKCRGREYLRIIYGPDYLLPGNLDRLRQRNVKAKRKLALREFALGVEGLERFVAGQHLRRVHQCVFGVLALESEAVDPRL